MDYAQWSMSTFSIAYDVENNKNDRIKETNNIGQRLWK